MYKVISFLSVILIAAASYLLFSTDQPNNLESGTLNKQTTTKNLKPTEPVESVSNTVLNNEIEAPNPQTQTSNNYLTSQEEKTEYLSQLTDFEYPILMEGLGLFHANSTHFLSQDFINEILATGRNTNNELKFGQLINQHFKNNEYYVDNKIICNNQQCFSQPLFERLSVEKLNWDDHTPPAFNSFCNNNEFEVCKAFGRWHPKAEHEVTRLHWQLLAEMSFEVPQTFDNLVAFNIDPANIVRLKNDSAIKHITHKLSSFKPRYDESFINSIGFKNMSSFEQDHVQFDINAHKNNDIYISDIYCEQEHCFVSINDAIYTERGSNGNATTSNITQRMLPFCLNDNFMFEHPFDDPVEDITEDSNNTHSSSDIIAYCVVSMSKNDYQSDIDTINSLDLPSYSSIYNSEFDDIRYNDSEFEYNEDHAIGYEREEYVRSVAAFYHPFLFEGSRPIINNKELISLINTSESDGFELNMILSLGYYDENKLGVEIGEKLNQQYLDSICGEYSCLIVTKEYDQGLYPCEIINDKFSDKVDGCEQSRFKNELTGNDVIWVTTIFANELTPEGDKTLPRMTDQHSLIEAGKLEEMFELYIRTKIATTSSKRSAPLNLSTITCENNQCGLSIENGYYGKTRGDKMITKLQLNLSDICELQNPDIDQLGGSVSKWQCDLN